MLLHLCILLLYLHPTSQLCTLLDEVPEALPHVESLVGRGSLHLGRLLGNILPRVPAGKLALLELLVEAGEREPEEPAPGNRDAKHGGDDAVGLAEPVLGQVPYVGAGDVAELGEGVDGSQRDGTLGWGPREG